MEAICSSETSVVTQQTTEDDTLQIQETNLLETGPRA
jgi:hypothetical protein